MADAVADVALEGQLREFGVEMAVESELKTENSRNEKNLESPGSFLA